MTLKRVKDGRRVLMGQHTTAQSLRIQLFDGLFTTGYRIVEFSIQDDFPTDGAELVAKLCTESKTNYGTFDYSDVRELAWATSSAPLSSRFSEWGEIRNDNMVIEDLWLSGYNPAEATTFNYKIVLEKYTFPAWDGAGILVENLSQAGPA
jgi:hypothetical protein